MTVTTKPADSTHAYSIVTTSTALLTRSNSTNTHLTTHSYSPARSNSHSSQSGPKRFDRISHRLSKSVTDIPPSLPAPPVSDTEFLPAARSRTFSDLSDSASDVSDYPDSTSDLATQAYEHPKSWDSQQLSSYFVAEHLPKLADHVLRHHITGRDCLALASLNGSSYTASDLEQTDVEELYKQARKLRVQVLRTRALSLITSPKPTKRNIIHWASETGKVKTLIRDFESNRELPRVRTCSGSSTSSSDSLASPNEPFDRPLGTIPSCLPDEVDDMLTLSPTSLPITELQLDADQGLPCGPDKQVSNGSIAFPVMDSIPPSLGDLPMDELVAQTQSFADHSPLQGRSWGAQAWEDACHGETVKKVAFPPAFPTAHLRLDEFGQHMSTSVELLDSPSHNPTLDPVLLRSHALKTSVISASKAPVEDMQQLHDRIAILESRIQELEQATAVVEPVPEINTAVLPAKESESEQMFDLDLPQYLVMAGIGICAIVFRRLVGLKS